MWQGDGTLGWSTVEGVIQGAEVESRASANINILGIPIYQRTGGYEVVVKYAYKVDTHGYEADRWSYAGGSIFADESAAEERARRFKEGESISVHYDPKEPERSVLKRGGGSQGIWTAIWGATLCLFALYGHLGA
jgi:hypothetical protein